MSGPRPSPRLKLRVSADGMKAAAKVGAGSPEGAEQLDAALQIAGIVYGINPAAHAALVAVLQSEEAHAVEVEIALGAPAGASRDGRFVPAFQPGLQPGHLREDGTIDFHDRELLKPVSIGETLGSLYPPVEGSPGMRVDGKRVAPRVARAVRIGNGAEVQDDGRVLATAAGVVIYLEARSVEVGTHYVHQGNIDLRSGDLSMEGSLVVRGDIERGFWVRATGDLEIKGVVDGGSAYAGANLKVTGGVRGGEGSMVSATGDMRARHIERARVDCGGILEVTDAINSDLTAVQIRIERSLRGGRAAVEVGLVTRDAGTPTSNAETVIEAGVPREPPVDDARRALDAAKAACLVRRRASARGSGPSDSAKAGKVARGLAEVQRTELARKIERAERIHAMLPLAFVEVHGTAHAGVQVRIGEARLLLQTATRNVRFTLDLERQTIRTEVATK